MKNVKNDESYVSKGRISYTLGDRKYFNYGTKSIIDKNIGFYSNSYYYITGKFK